MEEGATTARAQFELGEKEGTFIKEILFSNCFKVAEVNSDENLFVSNWQDELFLELGGCTEFDLFYLANR